MTLPEYTTYEFHIQDDTHTYYAYVSATSSTEAWNKINQQHQPRGILGCRTVLKQHLPKPR